MKRPRPTLAAAASASALLSISCAMTGPMTVAASAAVSSPAEVEGAPHDGSRRRHRRHNYGQFRRQRRQRRAQSEGVVIEEDAPIPVQTSPESHLEILQELTSSQTEDMLQEVTISSQSEVPHPVTGLPHDYHPRAVPCPGHEESGLKGYTSLSALQQDLHDYFYSFTTETPTLSPTMTAMPTTGTKSPTERPTDNPIPAPTLEPSEGPTPRPTEIPTKAPITLRPTPYPTSSIRQPLKPTSSPAPTIEMVIVGISTGGGPTPSGMMDGMGGPTPSDLDSFSGPTPNSLDGFAGPTPDVGLNGTVVNSTSNMEGGTGDGGMGGVMGGVLTSTSGSDRPTPSPGNEGNTLDQFMDNRMLAGGAFQAELFNFHVHRGKRNQKDRDQKFGHDEKSHEREHQSKGSHEQGQDGVRNQARTRHLRSMQEVGTGVSANELDSQLMMENGMLEEVGVTTSGASQGVTLDGGRVPASEGTGQGVTLDVEPESGEYTLASPGDGGSVIELDYDEGDEEGEGTPMEGMQTISAPASSLGGSPEAGGAPTAVTYSTSPQDTYDRATIRFEICPNAKLDYIDELALGNVMGPLVIETPVEHPLEIACLKGKSEIGEGGDVYLGGSGVGSTGAGTGCVLNGGEVHIEVRHLPDGKFTSDGYVENSDPKPMPDYPITISGITFAKSSETSVQMNDPRGKIAFKDCKWEDNHGTAAITIDGKYDSTQNLPTPAPVTRAPVARSHTTSTIDWTILGTSTTTTIDLITSSTIVGRELAEEDANINVEEEMLPVTEEEMLPLKEMEEAEEAKEEMGMGGEIDQEEMMIRRQEEMLARIDMEEEEVMMEQLEEEMSNERQSRSLEVDDVPRSIVSIERCTFSGNEALATIMVSSYSDELTLEDQDPGVLNHNDDLLNADGDGTGGQTQQEDAGKYMAHSIHLSFRDTTFDSEVVSTSVIENSGARVQSEGVRFVNNTAESIIRSEHGTVAMTATEFDDNELKGDEGAVVMDDDSSLEEAADNCAAVHEVSSEDADVTNTDPAAVPVSSTAAMQAAQAAAAEPVAGRCEGIKIFGVCTPFDSCEVKISSVGGDNSTTPSIIGDQDDLTQPGTPDTPDGGEDGGGSSTVDGGGEGGGQEDGGGGTSLDSLLDIAGTPSDCYSDWNTLVAAVRDEPPAVKDFVICPGADMIATPDNPVVISSDDVTIQCGQQGARKCVISGGRSHFKVVGSAKGVVISRLVMTGSAGWSVMALGGPDASLKLEECWWMENTGAASAVLIWNGDEEGLNYEQSADGQLEIVSLLSSSTGANPKGGMSVEVAGCTFENNELMFGPIANVGGKLSVSKTRFTENSSYGGDISILNEGTAKVENSCFSESSSVLPGTVFLGHGSELTSNVDNFGLGNTAGGYPGGTCTDAFQGKEGADCRGSLGCDGTCVEFSSSVCMLDAAGDSDEAPTPVSAPTQVKNVPEYNKNGEEGGSSKMVPIIVAVVVCVFIVFGLAGILLRRRKAKGGKNDIDAATTETGESPPRASICCCLPKRGGKNTDVYGDEEGEGVGIMNGQNGDAMVGAVVDGNGDIGETQGSQNGVNASSMSFG